MNIRLILDDIKNLNFEQSMVAHHSHPNFHYWQLNNKGKMALFFNFEIFTFPGFEWNFKLIFWIWLKRWND